MPKIRRLPHNPIIRPEMDNRMGDNVNGPSLIRVPGWLPNPLGKYYLYFAHHQGEYIRLAFSDELQGPWHTYEPGALSLSQTWCVRHIASPDVHVDHQQRQLRVYFHGPLPDHRRGEVSYLVGDVPWGSAQMSGVATSNNGIDFEVLPHIVGPSYFRAFQWGGYWYGLGMPGIFYRSLNGITDIEVGPKLFGDNQRHTAVRVRGDHLDIFYTNAGDCPERILLSTLDLRADWMTWQATEPVDVLAPETEWEGGHLDLVPSKRGSVHQPVRQLRDPAIFEDTDGKNYILYSVAGERGIAIAEILDEDQA